MIIKTYEEAIDLLENKWVLFRNGTTQPVLRVHLEYDEDEVFDEDLDDYTWQELGTYTLVVTFPAGTRYHNSWGDSEFYYSVDPDGTHNVWEDEEAPLPFITYGPLENRDARYKAWDIVAIYSEKPEGPNVKPDKLFDYNKYK